MGMVLGDLEQNHSQSIPPSCPPSFSPLHLHHSLQSLTLPSPHCFVFPAPIHIPFVSIPQLSSCPSPSSCLFSSHITHNPPSSPSSPCPLSLSLSYLSLTLSLSLSLFLSLRPSLSTSLPSAPFIHSFPTIHLPLHLLSFHPLAFSPIPPAPSFAPPSFFLSILILLLILVIPLFSPSCLILPLRSARGCTAHCTDDSGPVGQSKTRLSSWEACRGHTAGPVWSSS